MCLDVWAATARLDATLEFDIREGPIANARAEHFELAIQELINRSPWKPGSALAELRGRSLRHRGTLITDIDAIGECGGELLLVSCKSTIYSAEYDAGDYRTVRNVATTVSHAAEEWDRKISFLRTFSVGDNFDFSAFRHIVGIVCTPTAVYVPLGTATEEIRPGLRAASSMAELARWLGSPFRWPWIGA
jgi:hypothetical protein